MSNASFELDAGGPHIQVGDTPFPVRLVHHARARRYRLVFDAAIGELRLTLPRRANTARALSWATQQQDWLVQQVGKALAPVRVGPGTSIPLFGTEHRIDWIEGASRAVRTEADHILLGGPEDSVSRRLERWLKAEACALLTRESHEIAARAGLEVGRVGVGDPRSRWGSCTHAGDLRYSWRLIMAPSHVRRATVAHEVAHLRFMDHGADFHALVDELHDDDVDKARAWLRREGRTLHRFRFT